METEITPEPSDAERAAIELATAPPEDLAVPAPYRSPWRLAAIEEATEPLLD